MTRRLRYNQVLRNPETFGFETFVAGAVPPEWAAQQVTDPAAWDDDVSSDPGADADEAPEAVPPSADEPVSPPEPGGDDGTPEQPPRHGAGSSRDAWAVYAAQRGIDVDGLGRDELITAVDELDS